MPATHDPQNPKLLTSELITRVVDCLGIGMTRRLTALRVGIGEQTFYRWYNLGRDALQTLENDDELEDEAKLSKVAQFAKAVDTAEAEVAELATGIIVQAAGTDPTWAAWILTKRFQKDYMEKSTVEQSGTVRIEFVEVDKAADVPTERDDEAGGSPETA